MFLYKFGKKIFDKLMEAMQPQFKDEKPVNPFDLWKGADFKLKIRKVEGYWNYDKSEFAAASTLGKFDDEQLEAIWKKCYSLSEFEDTKNFKTFEELEARLDMVLNSAKPPSRKVVDLETQEDENWAPAKASNWDEEITSFKNTKVAAVATVDDEDEDKLSWFARLAEED